VYPIPLRGPILGPSSGSNNAYYDTLQALSVLSGDSFAKEQYHLQAHKLKAEMLRHFYTSSAEVYSLGQSFPINGIYQDAKAHVVVLGLLPSHTNDLDHLADSTSQLPRAFRGFVHWSAANVVSPYAISFAAYALLS
jgi:hypothetical protein